MQQITLRSLLMVLIMVSCDKQQTKSTPNAQELPPNNLLAEITTKELGDLKWLNEPKSFVIEGNTLKVHAEKGSDYFNNPEDQTVTSTAPFLYKKVKGDFIAKTLVRPDFSSMWNAASLMVYMDSTHWIKFAFENSDATGKSIVSVVTKDISDDANGVILKNQDKIWLKLIRKGDVYSMLWSLDDKNYKMARLSSMPPVDTLKIGIEAQCPVGKMAKHEFLYFGLERKTVKDVRKGE